MIVREVRLSFLHLLPLLFAIHHRIVVDIVVERFNLLFQFINLGFDFVSLHLEAELLFKRDGYLLFLVLLGHQSQILVLVVMLVAKENVNYLILIPLERRHLSYALRFRLQQLPQVHPQHTLQYLLVFVDAAAGQAVYFEREVLRLEMLIAELLDCHTSHLLLIDGGDDEDDETNDVAAGDDEADVGARPRLASQEVELRLEALRKHKHLRVRRLLAFLEGALPVLQQVMAAFVKKVGELQVDLTLLLVEAFGVE